MSVPDVAVLGTGLMGTALATALLKSGRTVAVWNRTPARATPLVGLGAVQLESVSDAIRPGSLVVLNVDSTTRALALCQSVQGVPWDDVVVVNTSTGSGEESEALGRLLASQGAALLEATICCFPRDIGTSEALLVYSGHTSVWEQSRQTLNSFAPDGSVWIGPEWRFAKIAGTSLTGCVYSLGMAGFVEGLAFAIFSGLQATPIIKGAQKMLNLLSQDLAPTVAAIEAGDYSTDQATVTTYAAAARGWSEAMRQRGLPGIQMTGPAATLEGTLTTGHGEDSFASMWSVVAPDIEDSDRQAKN